MRAGRERSLGLHVRSQSARRVQRQTVSTRAARLEPILCRPSDVGRGSTGWLLSAVSLLVEPRVGLSRARVSTRQHWHPWRSVYAVVALSRLDSLAREQSWFGWLWWLVCFCIFIVFFFSIFIFISFSYPLRCVDGKLFVRVVYDFHDCVRLLNIVFS